MFIVEMECIMIVSAKPINSKMIVVAVVMLVIIDEVSVLALIDTARDMIGTLELRVGCLVVDRLVRDVNEGCAWFLLGASLGLLDVLAEVALAFRGAAGDERAGAARVANL